MQYSLGLDFGTGSVRAVLVELEGGREAGHASQGYARGRDGVISDPDDPDFARQSPRDHLEGLRAVVPAVLRDAGIDAGDVVAVGVDSTGSTPLPVDARCRPLALDERFADHPAAQAWLWKDHTAQQEAEEITALAAERLPVALDRCGGTYSSEWFWAKVLRCRRTAPEVFAAAHSWLELCDLVPAWLVGAEDPAAVRRSVCAAGHKAMYGREWGGLPPEDFLAALDPELGALRARLYREAVSSDHRAGELAPGPAGELGLVPGTPVAVGMLDAHSGAVGAGIRPGELIKVLGTSSCDMAVAPPVDEAPPVTGLCGMVEGSIVPGLWGFEAGQAAVGDIFAWCTRLLGRPHDELTGEAAAIAPGASGLLALDWHAGNRSVLADPALSGLVLGLNLATTPGETYRAMIEGTAFGARAITGKLGACGVAVDDIVVCGGIAQRNPSLLQIYADVLGRPVHVVSSPETCAVGAAIAGAVAAGRFEDYPAAQRALVPPRTAVHRPEEGARAVYEELYGHYHTLHEAFGRGRAADVAGAMKGVLALRRRVRGP